MGKLVKSFVEDQSALVSPPDVWLRLNDVLQDSSASASDMAEVAARDPALTSKVLKVVNSPFYGFPARVDTLSRAITILGVNELFNIITSITVAKVFTEVPNALVRPETFWRHSLCTALAARRVAKRARILHPERLYIAGLLHDIGSLLLYRKFPEKAAAALLASNGNEEVLYSVETDLFGFNHAQVGAEVMRLWNLPPHLVGAVKYHHEPALTSEYGRDAAIVHISNVTANRMPEGRFVEELTDTNIQADPAVWHLTGLDSSVLEDTAEGLKEELQEALAMFMPQGRASH